MATVIPVRPRTIQGVACPVPLPTHDRVQLGHGSGGKMSALLLKERFLPRFGNRYLDALGDGALVPVEGGEVVLSTDTFVVSPLEFPGGNIGHLAVHGTVNDLAMMGAAPRYLSAGFVLEEGLPFEVLDRILDAMAGAAAACGVEVVTGDTKVVDRGKADGLFVNTTGVGFLHDGFRPSPSRARPGDAVLVSGPLARHGMAVMAVREGLEFDADIESDTASLVPLVDALRVAVGDAVHVLRDATRGGLASAINEIAGASRVGVELSGALPVPSAVEAACEMLGLDPLYVANEGVLVAFVAPEAEDAALAALRSHAVGASAMRVGRVVEDHPGMVVLRTGLGGTRVVDMLPGDQLPRIC
ncbi:MAG: hydrogenase expression/formation protein HypE [Gemmatimonadota bacterium]|nr:hydrogenase expression/formation protein HypE [Gemmatimonadota bacterium]MDH5758964.1 hydrogenase expression/formation protein HypE [Gemmatimonadota bacterium]